MKAALTIWEGSVSPVFDVSREALILTVDKGQISERFTENIETTNPALKVERLLELGVQTLICGAISEQVHHELTTRGVTVLGFVAGEVAEVLRAFAAGELPASELSMPGYRQQEQNRFRGGRGSGGARGRGGGKGRGSQGYG